MDRPVTVCFSLPNYTARMQASAMGNANTVQMNKAGTATTGAGNKKNERMWGTLL